MLDHLSCFDRAKVDVCGWFIILARREIMSILEKYPAHLILSRFDQATPLERASIVKWERFIDKMDTLKDDTAELDKHHSNTNRHLGVGFGRPRDQQVKFYRELKSIYDASGIDAVASYIVKERYKLRFS